MMKKTYLWGCLILLIYLFFEGASWAGLRLLKALRDIDYQPTQAYTLSEKHREILEDMLAGKNSHVDFSPTLGWTLRKGYRSERDRINATGFRSDKDYPVVPDGKKVRITSFGDSFTYGDEVANEETWQEQMMQGDSGVEVLNFGIGAYGLDQAYLRYEQDGRSYNADIVFIGFMSENIARNVNVFRPFYFPNSAAPLTKPRFRPGAEGLTLVPNPFDRIDRYRELLDASEKVLPEIGKEDYWFRTKYKAGPLDFLPSVRLYKLVRFELFAERLIKEGVYNRDSAAFRVTTSLFDRFVQRVIEEGALPTILLFPTKGDVMIYRNSKKKLYAPLLDYLKEKNYPYLDLMDAFEARGRYNSADDLFLTYHYSPLGNRIVAAHLLDRLRRANLLDRENLEKQTAAVKALLLNKVIRPNK